jgi:uncharacterized MAPEG superfamily protein
MTNELYWLTLTALLTSLLWVPYILNRFVEIGIITAMMNPERDSRPTAQWAERMMCAHTNAIENLVVFAVLALVVHLSATGNDATALAVEIYFYSRLFHFIAYSLGVPGLRTLSFLAGFGCQIVLGLTAIGLL